MLLDLQNQIDHRRYGLQILSLPPPPPGSSGDSGDCGVGSQGPRVPTQKSYSSSETLKAFDQHQDQTRLLYGTTRGHKDMVHREQGDFSRQAFTSFIEEPPMPIVSPVLPVLPLSDVPLLLWKVNEPLLVF
ncbi:unnamed protein product [Boreogadus saida]